MRDFSEYELDSFIDILNQEKEPKGRFNPEAAEMLAVVRAVKRLRPQAEPSADLGRSIIASFGGHTRRRRTMAPVIALAAGLLLFAVFAAWSGMFNTDVVYAMEKAVARLSNYYGVLEVREKNAAGEEWTIRKVELWSEGNKYAMRDDHGNLTVNNGERKWQVRPQDRVVALLPLVPDPTRHGFDLRDEAKKAKQYPHEVVGREVVAGRRTTKLQISPPGGLPYYLWIDEETNLPLQLQTAMTNALQTTMTFVSFEPNTEIDPAVFEYNPPPGFKVVEKDSGQLVATGNQAAAIAGFTPLFPKNPPARIFAHKERIVLDYGETTVTEMAAKGPFKPEPGYGALGSAAGGPLEVTGERLRWQQKGVEILIEGPEGLALARQIAPDITLPDTSKSLTDKAKIKVPVDLEQVKNDQRQVDAGHGPWQLDPLQVAHTFVNLQVSPEGIVGEPKIPMTSLKMGANNGAEAVVEVAEGPAKTVYLKRLVRQDDSGIWSVVGYDPR